jgi:hypothetical protein
MPSDRFRRFLERIAGDGKGGISEQRLDEWLHRNSGRRPVQLSDGHAYQMVQGRDHAGHNTFKLEEIK